MPIYLVAATAFCLGVILTGIVLLRWLEPRWSISATVRKSMQERLWEIALTQRRIEEAENWARSTREKCRRLRLERRRLRALLDTHGIAWKEPTERRA